MEELVFPIERNSAMHRLGILMTGAVSGRILVSALLLIGIAFMGTQGFSPISIMFFIVFIGPMSVLVHKRLVKRGKLLMRELCTLKIDGENITYWTGYPNSMNPYPINLTIDDKNKDIVIKGELDTGYHLRLTGNAYPPTMFGLWYDLEEARKAAEMLKKYTKGAITEELNDIE